MRKKEVHGNAGHVAQGWRTDTYRHLASQPNTHVITIDYRGFGQSKGSPTEAGIVADGTALLNWVLKAAGIPPERIVLLGQSLGTAVASAVALRFVDPDNALLSPLIREGDSVEAEPFLHAEDDPIRLRTFAGIILVAPFYSLPSLMLTYRIGGLLPLLLPLRPFPSFASWITDKMVDTWPTGERLRAYYDVLVNNPKLLSGAHGRRLGSVQVIHATNDADISYRQTEMICRRMLEEFEMSIDGSRGGPTLDVTIPGRPGVRFEIVEHGGRQNPVLRPLLERACG